MKTALIIALQFAPVQTTGAFRSIDLVKYLPSHDIEPIVVTIEPDQAALALNSFVNPELLSGLPEGLQTLYLRSNRPHRQEGQLQTFFRLLTNLNDGFDRRYKHALIEALGKIGGQRKVDVVYSSQPPFGAARLAERAAEHLGVPLILDFRDSWAEWDVGPYTTYLHYLAQRKGEQRAFLKADRVIATTTQMRDLFIRCHPNIPSSKFQVAYNGFDGPLFEKFDINLKKEEGHFDIGYVGSFYYTPIEEASFISKLTRPHRLLQYHRRMEDWSYRSPKYFFQAWQALFEMVPEVASRVRFHHFGTTPPWLRQMAADYGVDKQCQFWGVVPRQEVAEKMDAMDALLITSMKRLDGEDYFIASKTFEYFAARKPIVAFVTKGAQREILQRSNVAKICDPDDTRGSSEMLETMVVSGCSLSLDETFVNQFSRNEMARQISEIISGAAEAGRT